MLSAASSFASVLDSADTDDRTMFESARFGTGSFTVVDEATTIAPPPRDLIDGTARRTIRTALRTSCSNVVFQTSSSNESVSPAGGPPAFAYTRSTPPNFSIVLACHAVSDATDFTSAAMPSVSMYVSAAIFFAASLTEASLRDDTDTFTPSAASARATA